jgi:menaquinone-dependent protoporphyrinogen IX oxidase
MKRILIAYTTNAGSTGEVAQLIAETLGQNGDVIDIQRIEEVISVDGYDAVIVGAPMILGWHGAARKFVKKHRQALSRIKVAYFCTAMMLTQRDGENLQQTAVCIDPNLAQTPRNPAYLSIKERYSLVGNYLRPILKAAPAVQPLSVAFFGGKLELFRLNIAQMLFVMLIIRAQPGDMRNESLIREWAIDLRPLLLEG